MANVELDLVAELGRVRRRLSLIDALRVGDVIRLETPVRSPVLVRVQSKPLLRARPTTSGTQLAVIITERLEDQRSPALDSRMREEIAFIESAREVPA